jgi:hypothetical protein
VKTLLTLLLFVVVAIATLFALPCFAVDTIAAATPGIPIDPATVDPLGLIQQIAIALKAHNWLLAVPLALIGIVALARTVGTRYWPFLATSTGGALLGLLAVVGGALAAAAIAPGAHSALQVIVAAGALLLANQTFFTYLKKLLAPSGAEKAEVVAANAAAVGVSAGASATAAAAAINDAK